jgi:hypothetical protein
VRDDLAASMKLTVITPEVLDNFELADTYHGRTSHADIAVQVAIENTH